MKKRTGKFITLEGGEGAGKTSQLQTICRFLEQRGVDVITTREPGGTEIAEKIRNLLLDKEHTALTPDTELLLVFAARAQHLQELILPTLEKGVWVVSDRFTDASFAYQGYGRGLEITRIQQLQQWLQGGFEPDLTLLFDLPVETGMRRARKRGAMDRFEVEQIAFFERIRKGYLQLAQQHSQRIKIIDASLPLDQVSENVCRQLQDIL